MRGDLKIHHRMNTESQIEAILFWEAEPVSREKLAEIIGKSAEEIDKAISSLEGILSGRGLRLQIKDDEVTIATAPEMSPLIEKLAKEELSKDIGKAGLETLSIVLYRGPIARRDIDYIRGVNSGFILRNLLVRGLVERIQNKEDERVFLYRPAFELLSYLGISKLEELPDFAKVQEEVLEFEEAETER